MRDPKADDAQRRFGRRGVARCILEAEARGDESYFESHPIASDFRAVTPRKRLNRWASERSTDSSGVKVFGLAVSSSDPKAAKWPK